MAMAMQLREHWRDLQQGRPGHRFQDRYQRARKTNRKTGMVQRIAIVVAALLCIAIGVVLSVIPGPAIPFFLLGGGLLAAESLAIARLMDWIELRVRDVWHWAVRRWKPLPLWAKALIALTIVASGCATSYLLYTFVRS